jgi:glycosyltransferase involved in cell wall biosynthesis
MGNSHRAISIAVISGPVGQTPEDITYSFVFDEAYRLAKKGIDVHIVRSKIEKDSFSYDMHFHGIERRIDSGAIRMMPRTLSLYPLISLLRKPTSIYWENLYAESVSRVVEKNNVDLIHAHFAYPEGLVGLLAKRKTKKPLIITVHGYDILTEPDVNFGIRLSKRYDSIVKNTIKWADAIIVNSKAVCSEVLKCGAIKERLWLIPLGVDLERFSPATDDRKLKKELQIEDKYIVFTLKAHEQRYRIEDVINAASLALKQRQDIIFLIGGQGSLKPYHENLSRSLGISSHVIFLGRMPFEKLPLFYSICDVFVNPALGEGFGIVSAEAMATGKPVIAVRRYGSLDLVSDGVNGFLVDPRSPKQIAEKILWLIENPEEAKRMGLNGRKIVEEKFDIGKRIDRIKTLYMNLLGRAKSGILA